MEARLFTVAAAALLAACGQSEAQNNGAPNAAPSADAAKSGSPAVPAGPEGAVLAEFDRACGDVASVETLNAAAPGAGWQAFEPEANSDLGRILAFAEQQVRPMIGDAELRNWSYQKELDGRRLILVVSEIPSGPARSIECRVYDFVATAPPTEAAVTAWAGRPPTERIAEQGLTAFQWTPGFRAGLGNQSVLFLEPESPLRQQIPAVGLAVTATRGGAVQQ